VRQTEVQGEDPRLGSEADECEHEHQDLGGIGQARGACESRLPVWAKITSKAAKMNIAPMCENTKYW
jgi:hypothetical protein